MSRSPLSIGRAVSSRSVPPGGGWISVWGLVPADGQRLARQRAERAEIHKGEEELRAGGAQRRRVRGQQARDLRWRERVGIGA